MRWRYYVAQCWYKVPQVPGRASSKDEGYWVLSLDREYPLVDGLNHMGELGYELVGIQPTGLRSGGQYGQWYEPSSFYVFKIQDGPAPSR